MAEGNRQRNFAAGGRRKLAEEFSAYGRRKLAEEFLRTAEGNGVSGDCRDRLCVLFVRKSE